MNRSEPLPWPVCLCAETLDADSIAARIGTSVPRTTSDNGPKLVPSCHSGTTSCPLMESIMESLMGPLNAKV